MHDLLGTFAGVLGHLRDEPDAQRDVRAEALAGHEVASRSAADLREDERRDHRRDDPEPHLGEAEDGVGPSDGDVGARDEPGAAAERESVDAADHGRRARVDRLEHAIEAHRVFDVLVV